MPVEQSQSSHGEESTERVFAQVLEQAMPGLRRHVRGQLGNADVVEDTMQETFLRMLRYRDIDDAGAIRALLYRVVATVVADNYRSSKAREGHRHCSLDGLELASATSAPERVLAGRENLTRVKQAIGNLPPRCRQVFLLHRFEGLSYGEIAERLGTSPRTVENQIAHALRVCRRTLGEQRGRAGK